MYMNVSANGEGKGRLPGALLPVPEGGKLGQLKIMIIGLIEQGERGEGGYLEYRYFSRRPWKK